MKITRAVVLAVLFAAVALPAFAKHYKNTYPVACTEIWPAVTDTLGNPDNYTVIEKDDAKMTATYDVKHQVHTNISGALLQRKNKVTLLPKGTGCELDVVSNYSGWEHDDQGDFKKRVDEAMTKPKPSPAAQAAAPAPSTK